MAKDFNFMEDCTYDESKKAAFHSAAKKQLKKLATTHLGFPAGSYDLRSNKGGIAVSGEITLHHDDIYITVSQSSMGSDRSVMLRTCEGRKDYSGGQNNFASLGLLGDDNLPVLAEKASRILSQKSNNNNAPSAF